MDAEEIEDVLHDMVTCALPDETTGQREKLALFLAGLDRRLRNVEREARNANNVASCLANGIIPD